MIGSLHDISDGGFLPSLVENLMLNQLGIEFHIMASYQKDSFLFSELPGHFIVSIKKENRALFEEFFKREEYEFIGETNPSGKIIFEENSLDINELASIWRNP
jgi:phosphoribosylformylglycinamidine synthase